MIPTVQEPKFISDNEPWEKCFFCNKPTIFWHWRTNQPVCPKCSTMHKVAELPKAHPDYKVPTKAEYMKDVKK